MKLKFKTTIMATTLSACLLSGCSDQNTFESTTSENYYENVEQIIEELNVKESEYTLYYTTHAKDASVLIDYSSYSIVRDSLKTLFQAANLEVPSVWNEIEGVQEAKDEIVEEISLMTEDEQEDFLTNLNTPEALYYARLHPLFDIGSKMTTGSEFDLSIESFISDSDELESATEIQDLAIEYTDIFKSIMDKIENEMQEFENYQDSFSEEQIDFVENYYDTIKQAHLINITFLVTISTSNESSFDSTLEAYQESYMAVKSLEDEDETVFPFIEE